MSLNIAELFGYRPESKSPKALKFRKEKQCPYIGGDCTKRFSDGERSGVCAVVLPDGNFVICCPNRLYAGNYQILSDVAESAFGKKMRLLPAHKAIKESMAGDVVAVFGKRWGKELRLPSRGASRGGGYFVDWILALIGGGTLKEFIAVEVQTIDTTGSYRRERDAYIKGDKFHGMSIAGLNWENVSKRILPQIIYKGHVLRREPLCQKGLYFICPEQIYSRIIERLGGKLLVYRPQPGSLTFRWYNMGSGASSNTIGELKYLGQNTTTIDQVALAFTSPSNLPPEGVYEEAINQEIKKCNE